MSLSPPRNPVAFHISMNVSDIDRSVDFFSKVLGAPATKHRKDYAKFELQNPPMTFSLEPGSPAERGALNHVGFKMETAEELVELQRRLEMAGIHSEREEGVECCYSKQTKFWLHDPDGALWEFYILEGDIGHRGAGQSAMAIMGNAEEPSNRLNSSPCAAPERSSEKAEWLHRLGDPLSIPAEIGTGTLDEIALQGTFNAEDAFPRMRPFLKDAADRLKAGGRLLMHCLTADRHIEEVPQLPGPASVVKSVPCLDSCLELLSEAGFENVRLTTYRSHACFTAGEAELRETRIEATKPEKPAEEDRVVIYKGPFAELKLDSGIILRRGQKTLVPRNVAEQLQSVSNDNAFVILETAASPVACAR